MPTGQGLGAGRQREWGTWSLSGLVARADAEVMTSNSDFGGHAERRALLALALGGAAGQLGLATLLSRLSGKEGRRVARPRAADPR